MDAISYSNLWVAKDGEDEVAHCKSVGYLVKKDREKIVIAQSLAQDGDVMNKFVIPRGCVRSIREIK